MRQICTHDRLPFISFLPLVSLSLCLFVHLPRFSIHIHPEHTRSSLQRIPFPRHYSTLHTPCAQSTTRIIVAVTVSRARLFPFSLVPAPLHSPLRATCLTDYCTQMSVPRLLLTVRPNRVTTLPVRSAPVSINHSKAAFAMSTRQGLHTGAPNLRRPLVDPSSTPTVAAATLTSSPRSVRALNNNRPLLAPVHITSCQRYSISTPATTNDQIPPLFATSSLYPDDKRVFFFDIDNCLYPKSSGIPHLMKARYVIPSGSIVDSRSYRNLINCFAQ